MNFKTAGVIGAGAWGTALAQSAAAAGLQVTLQARETEVADSIRKTRINEAFLPGIELDASIAVTSDLADLAGCDLILAVPPAQHMRATLAAFAPYARDGLPIVLCSKGIERGSLKLMADVLAETIPHAVTAVLSGPSFAAEVARGLPSAVTLACADIEMAEKLAGALSGPVFRPYYAEALGQGQTVEQALAGKRSVAEGYESAPAVRELSKKLGVETPIIEAVASVLAGETTVDAAIQDLMKRPIKPERE